MLRLGMMFSSEPASSTEAAFVFSAQESARLLIYRNAVLAGFYNDEIGTGRNPRAGSRTSASLSTEPRRRRAH
jgi:hypothetical protein